MDVNVTLRLGNFYVALYEANQKLYASREMLESGFVVLGENPSPKTMEALKSAIGFSGNQMNQSFHKSWKTVRDSDTEKLMAQQILHYLTTYGFLSGGPVYIPSEVLNLPKGGQIPLILIRAMGMNDAKKLVENLCYSTLPLSESFLTDLLIAVMDLNVRPDFKKITNRELTVRLYDLLKIAPTDPMEWLRYVVYKLTGETLIIKNQQLIDKLLASDQKQLDRLLTTAPARLAEIFLSKKPLFLAMKKVSQNKGFFNALRKHADKMHHPMRFGYLDRITEDLQYGELNVMALKDALWKAQTYQKIRAANALRLRLAHPSNMVYTIRNGKSWVQGAEWIGDESLAQEALGIILSSITEDLRENVSGNVYYIPEGVEYALPTSQKKFLGNVPYGTSVSVPKDMILGVYWTDNEDSVDLDFSLLTMDGDKYGWNGGWRSNDNSVLFSGDVTRAPEGASELYYLKDGVKKQVLLCLNHFNRHDESGDIDAKLFVARDKTKELEKNYMVNPQNVLIRIPFKVAVKQEIVGVVDGNTVYFTHFSQGNDRVISYNERTQKTLEFLLTQTKSLVKLNDLLEAAGATIVREKVEGCIDLSPESVTVQAFLDMLK